MANEKVNKVVLGNETLIDLTGDTVSANNLLSGATAHDSRGEQIQGAVSVPTQLNDLSDVDTSSNANNEVLAYNSTSSKWKNKKIDSIGVAFTQASSRTNIATGETLATLFGKIKKYFADLKTVAFTGMISDLSDVTINSATNGQFLVRDSSVWKNKTVNIPEAYRLYVQVTFNYPTATLRSVKLKQGRPATTTINLTQASNDDIPHKPNDPFYSNVEWYYLDVDDVRTIYSQEAGWYYEVETWEQDGQSITAYTAEFDVPYMVITSPMFKVAVTVDKFDADITEITQFYDFDTSVELTQAEYDALEEAGTVDPDVEYMITDRELTCAPVDDNDVSQNKTWSSKKISESQAIYSTEERVVGTWIDGKPLYRKVIVDTMPSTGVSGFPPTTTTTGTKNIDLEVSVDTFVNISGFMNNNGNHNKLGIVITNNMWSSIWGRNNSTSSNANTIALMCGTSAVDLPCTIILEYTKTTD